MIIYSTKLKSPLGTLTVLADDSRLYYLNFSDSQEAFERYSNKLKKVFLCTIKEGLSPVISRLKNQLQLYFSGSLTTFDLKLNPIGTDFQKKVWEALNQIQFGKTTAYQDIALAIKMPKASRAVANAIGANPIAILIPCHRIIRQNGALGGYAGGVERKGLLLHLEKDKAFKIELQTRRR